MWAPTTIARVARCVAAPAPSPLRDAAACCSSPPPPPHTHTNNSTNSRRIRAAAGGTVRVRAIAAPPERPSAAPQPQPPQQQQLKKVPRMPGQLPYAGALLKVPVAKLFMHVAEMERAHGLRMCEVELLGKTAIRLRHPEVCGAGAYVGACAVCAVFVECRGRGGGGLCAAAAHHTHSTQNTIRHGPNTCTHPSHALTRTLPCNLDRTLRAS